MLLSLFVVFHIPRRALKTFYSMELNIYDSVVLIPCDAVRCTPCGFGHTVDIITICVTCCRL